MMKTQRRFQPVAPRTQRGISLIVVMVMLLLGVLLAVGTVRNNWLQESLVSNESDYQRAFAAAEALVADAEADIRGVAPGGGPCRNNPALEGCRDRAGNQMYIPLDRRDLDEVMERMNTLAPGAPCVQGLCFPINEVALGANWWDPASPQWAVMQAGGATYGQYTQAALPAVSNNLLLQPTSQYWIEVMEYNTKDAINNPSEALPVPSQDLPFVYRITAVVNGNKPGTRVVLRSIFVPSSWLNR